MIVNSTLSNNRVGIAVILDAASVNGSYVDPEVNAFFLILILKFDGSRSFHVVIIVMVMYLFRSFSQL